LDSVSVDDSRSENKSIALRMSKTERCV
jgi:hypothetical protein